MRATEGIGSFKIGANKVSSFTVPDGAESFMEAGGKCVGYFGSVNGVRVVRVGFDIRETDFPVQAEFPVFMAHSMKFLSEQGLLAQNEYTAGEPVRLSPSADMDISGLNLSTDKAGIYAVEKRWRRFLRPIWLLFRSITVTLSLHLEEILL